MADRKAEQVLAYHILVLRLPKPEREYRFHKKRKWRFDFAWPDHKIAAEVEGGIWVKGRHTRGLGFLKDCEKYNAAAEDGWRVFRYPTSMVNDGTASEQLARVLGMEDEDV